MTLLDPVGTRAFIDEAWEATLPVLADYIRFPNVSPVFDPQWEAAGDMDRAAAFLADWCRSRPLGRHRVDTLRIPGRTPMLLIDVPATTEALADDTVVLYGHLDKQPEMEGWRAGLGPWEPVLEGDLLYGRGAGDDGYAVFASLLGIEAVEQAGRDHARCLVLIEASEESGSPDLPAYMDDLARRIGAPSLVLALDAGTASYDRLWVTNAMRGLTSGVLTVDILREGVHSGVASGIVPSSFRILRQLLDRIEDSRTGELLVPELYGEIPDWATAQAEVAGAAMGERLAGQFPFVEGARPVEGRPAELELNSTWRPTLSYIGAAGLPPPANAGNVLRPRTSVTLSFRLPPNVDPDAASDAIERWLTVDPPYGAHVTYRTLESARGWASPAMASWLGEAVAQASRDVFGKDARSLALGGTIPFMATLGAAYPDAQFVVTGTMGPGSNAHGPNEFLHVPMTKGVTAAVAHLLAAHAARPRP